MQDDLIERLRNGSCWRGEDADLCTPNDPCTPCKAADRIAALEAEVARLREALGLIIENESTDTGYGNSSAKIARAALAGEK